MMPARPGSLLVPLLIFLAGLLVGWLLIGWWLLPPSPRGNATPAALTEVYSKDYLALVADSYAQNGNIAVVRQRLQGFDLAQAARDLTDLARASESVGLAPQATRMRNLATVINRGDIGPLPGGTAPAVKATGAAVATAPAAPAAEARGLFGNTPSDWIIIAAFGLLGAALLVWAWQRWSLSRVTPSAAGRGPAAPAEPVQVAPGEASPGAAVQAGQVAGPLYVSLNQPARIAYYGDDAEHADLRIIENKTVIGQVDLRVAEILRPDPGQPPAALELRLFDRRAARTIAAVLVSHEAYMDPTARQLVHSLPNNVVKPAFDVSRIGRLIVLETRHLRLQAEVVDIEFGSDGRYPAFVSLVLEVTPMPAEDVVGVVDADYAEADTGDDTLSPFDTAEPIDGDDDDEDTSVPPPRGA